MVSTKIILMYLIIDLIINRWIKIVSAYDIFNRLFLLVFFLLSKVQSMA